MTCMKNPAVSVIVPIYNSGKYIEKCSRSLFGQTLDDIEYIFINDCTPDNSMQILDRIIKEHPDRQPRIKIFNNKENLSTSATRNIGIDNATGDYIIHCDSDDWIEPEMYEDLYKKAISNDSDIVYCGHYYIVNNRQFPIIQDCITDKNEVIKALLNWSPAISCFLMTKLVKRDLYIKNNIRFPSEFNIFEDLATVVRFFYYSTGIAYLPKPYYYYYLKDSSISRSGANKTFKDDSPFIKDSINAQSFIHDFFKSQNALGLFQREINHSKLSCKSVILAAAQNRKKWIGLFPESNRNISSVPRPITTKIALRFAAADSVTGYNLTIFIHKTLLRIIRLFNKGAGYY